MLDSLKTILFATLLGVICAMLLSGTSLFCKKYIKANEKAEETRNILGVLGIDFAKDADAASLLKIFKDKVKLQKINNENIYKYIEKGRTKAVAAKFKGPGLWGSIEGIMAFEPDLEQIKGVSFYKQEETPGLGGEIGKLWFTKQFIGKKITGIHFAKGKADKDDEIDSITSATLTCDKVQTILNKISKKVGEYRTQEEK